jgi:hypothetical protein
MLGDLVLLIYIYMADATSTHIYALCKRLAALAFCTTRCDFAQLHKALPPVALRTTAQSRSALYAILEKPHK